ncbi:hypothetical protein P168DRAFT_186497 [Aspergillus campestris IBT 28561]|uniref:Uncharacterized protein n=1 Tax=Aspergillus campestris (strain IBT 28561) TaxID=1392248 RepID=A0A2I1CY67_ASPC2|nr:uncharacterized protein P168DRAFT_186497 [Aspergillus campestris IBT 28561]PKY02567.1 hypothetical protein P168DRAFT_186497 [Aspergillus campestris IBT 28561]
MVGARVDLTVEIGWIYRSSLSMPHVAASCFIMIPTPRREELKEETAFPVRMGYVCISPGQASGNLTECIDPRPGVFLFLFNPSTDPSTSTCYVNYSASSSLEPPKTLLSFPFLSLLKPSLCILDS